MITRAPPVITIPQSQERDPLRSGYNQRRASLAALGLTLGRRFRLFAALTLSIAAAGGLRAASDVVKEEFTITTGGTALKVLIHSPPPARLAPRPLLVLYLSADRQSSMPDGRYGAPGRLALEQGHRIASFDLPAHGERVDRHGSGIVGLAALVAAGEAPFDRLVADGRAMIGECIRRGLAEEGRVVVAGVSRGGYCALRLAAGDSRIGAVAAFAPVTDWREVTEFAAQKGTPTLAALALERFAEPLAGRRVYVAIGNKDDRVGTDACTRFILALAEAERRLGAERSGIRFHLVDDSAGHGLATRWREEGIRFLLETSQPGKGGLLP